MPLVDTIETFQMTNVGTHIDGTDVYQTNPNLLDNPWWGSGEVVNQRGVTAQPSSNGTYCIDRWVWTTGATANTMSLTANGLAFTIASSSVWFAQRGVYAKILSGKTYTASVMLSDGTIKSGTGTVNTGTQTTFYTDSQLTLYLSTDGTFTCTVRATQTIRAVKLELGSVSTLANDVPPDYGTELAKCQRYFVRALGDPFGTGYITTAGNNSRITVPVPMTMRAIPTVSFSGTFRLRVQGSTLNVTTMSAVSPKNTAGGITLLCSGFSGATTGICALYADGTSDYIDFSADL